MFAAMHARNNTIIHNEFSNLVRDSCDPGKETPLLQCHLYTKCIILPRQARDKHRESTQKRVTRFLRHARVIWRGQGPTCHWQRCPRYLNPAKALVKKRSFLIYKNDDFTKTGSGQTQGKRSKKDRVLAGGPPLRRLRWASRSCSQTPERTFQTTLRISFTRSTPAPEAMERWSRIGKRHLRTI